MSTPEAAQKPEAQPFSRPLLLLLVAWLVMLYFRDQQRKSTLPTTPHTSPATRQRLPVCTSIRVLLYARLTAFSHITRGLSTMC